MQFYIVTETTDFVPCVVSVVEFRLTRFYYLVGTMCPGFEFEVHGEALLI